jgi:two-component sensor histidine kinase
MPQVASQQPSRSDFERDVAGRFGLVPSFFSSAPEAPEIIEKLWTFAQAAYLDNPMPSIFKERLFVYVSRFCQNRYCITRHCAFLVGRGHPSGDPEATPQTVDQAIRLLTKATPWQRETDVWLTALETAPPAVDWPSPETELEDQMFAAASLVFAEAGRSERARRALRHLLGGRRFEHLLGLLTFIRTAHYWTLVHPDLLPEEDVEGLLAANAELARLLLNDPEAGQCDIGSRLFAELQSLRELNERHELELAKQALEVQVEQKELLLKEVNHRVKNSLQVVASLLHLEAAHLGNSEPATAMRGAASRVAAIAAVHERLYTDDDLSTVALGAFLGDLCADLGQALGCSDIELDLAPAKVPTDIALPLALIVNELVTNAIKHGGNGCRIVLRSEPGGALKLTVSDVGSGPSAHQSRRPGMGSRIMEGLARQLSATMETKSAPNGYTVEVAIPLSPVS